MEAFIDRLHYYLPGWDVPKIGPESASQDYGFITDYLCEIMHELRRADVLGQVKSRFELFDASGSSQGLTSRDVQDRVQLVYVKDIQEALDAALVAKQAD